MSEAENEMVFDVVIVGAGPAGLSAACRLKQMAQQQGQALSVCVIEKAAEVGGHILSGAVMDPRAMHELFPDWQQRGAPLEVAVSEDEFHYLLSDKKGIKFPHWLVPKPAHNDGNYVVSLANVCRWLAQQAEALGVEVYPGFSASEILFDEHDGVAGIRTGDMGVSALDQHKSSYMPGMVLRAKYTVFAEGCRGHLGKILLEKYQLDADADTQHYGLGIKELWRIDPALHKPGKVVHAFGWPLSENGATGGGFLYHLDNNQVSLGLITDLNYDNCFLSPYEEFQRFKTHPLISRYLQGGERLAYGARALNKGGVQALPKLSFPGGLLAGCEAGFMNYAKIKGSHNAMKTGMLAAETIFEALNTDASAADSAAHGGANLIEIEAKVKNSWVYQELYQSRNIAPAMHKFGMLLGGAYAFVDQNIFNGRLPHTWQDPVADFAKLKPRDESHAIEYAKPDGVITFDKLSSVYLSATHHAEDQPCHLQLSDTEAVPRDNLLRFDEPAQRYCPAGVYEIVPSEEGESRLQINAQNCIHCKTCDIKDPAQNITWVCPEGGGGPSYPNM